MLGRWNPGAGARAESLDMGNQACRGIAGRRDDPPSARKRLVNQCAVEIQARLMSVNALARRLGMPTSRLNDIVLERRGVTPDTAMRLARCFGGDARSWLNLQTAHALRLVEIKKAREIERTVESFRDSA